MIDALHYISIHASIFPETPMHLPRYKGFTLRGIIGKMLKNRYCLNPNKNCENCPYLRGCPYGYLYEIKGWDPRYFRFGMSLTKPYNIVVNDTRKIFLPGESLSFNFLLWGNAKAFLPSVIEGIKGIKELGKGTKRGYGKVSSISVNVEEKVFRPIYMRHRWRIETITPMIINSSKEFVASPSARDIGMRIARGYYSLSLLYYGKKPQMDFLSLKEMFESMEVVVNRLKKVEVFYRWSERRKKREIVVGIVGSITFSLEMLSRRERSILSYLSGFASVRGIGKRVTAGMGQVKITSY